MATQKNEIETAYKSFVTEWAKMAKENDKANFAIKNEAVIKQYIVKKLQSVSNALGNENVKLDNIGQVAGVYRKSDADNRAFNRESLNAFLDSLRNCRQPAGRSTIKARNCYGGESNTRYFVDPDALSRLLSPPKATVVSGGIDVTGRPIAPEKPAPVKLSDLYDADVYSKEFNVSRAHYDRYASILAKYEKGSYKSTLKAKKLVDSNGSSWKIPVAVSHLDHVLQGIINLGVQEYLKEDSLALLNKLFSQECMALSGKKRGLGSEVERYLKCILPSLQLKAIGDGDARRFQYVKRKGYDRALYIYDVISTLDNGKKPTTPLISLRNFFVLENELKALRRIQSAKNAERHAEAVKLYEERMNEFEAALAEQAAKQ